MSSDDVPQRGQHPALSRQPEPTPRSSVPTSPPPYPQLAIAALAADPVIERLRADIAAERERYRHAQGELARQDLFDVEYINGLRTEIERLRAELAAERAKVERLRALIASAATLLSSFCDGVVIYPDEAQIIAAIQQEARRG